MAKILKEIGFNDALPRVFSTWASWGESPPHYPPYLEKFSRPPSPTNFYSLPTTVVIAPVPSLL